MFVIYAPYPSPQTASVLPNPQLSDSVQPSSEVSSQRAMDGTLYTYVKTAANRQKVQWEFKLTRNKSLELRAFINSYFASTLKVIDHEDRVWIGNLSSNPFDFVTDQRAAPAFDGWPKGESVSITLAFEGVQQ